MLGSGNNSFYQYRYTGSSYFGELLISSGKRSIPMPCAKMRVMHDKATWMPKFYINWSPVGRIKVWLNTLGRTCVPRIFENFGK